MYVASELTMATPWCCADFRLSAVQALPTRHRLSVSSAERPTTIGGRIVRRSSATQTAIPSRPQFDGPNAVTSAPRTTNPPHSSGIGTDRKSTRLNSSHVAISYAVFCLQKKNTLAGHNDRTQRPVYYVAQ